MLKGSAFPLEVGMNKQTTGTFKGVRGVRCYEDGDLAITFIGGAVSVESFVAGEDMELNNVDELDISSGKFSLTIRNIA